MTIQNKTILKSYFEEGDSPSESDFSDLIDSLAHVSEQIISSSAADIRSMIGSETLLPGQFYQIAFQTKHLIPNTSTIQVGTEETLVVLAISGNTISQRAFSVSHPADIILLDLFNIVCEDELTSRDGKITYRKDILRNLETWYDFRNVIFRRWKIDAASNSSIAWQSVTEYNAGTVVVYQDVFYKCLISHTSTANFEDQLWQVILPDTSGYIAWDLTMPIFGSELNANSSDFMDYKSFDAATSENISIAPVSGGSLNNIVILTGSSGNIIRRNSANITIGINSYNNTIGEGCSSMLLSESHSNLLGNGCTYNSFFAGANFNRLSKNCQNNHFNNAASYNQLSDNCNNNYLSGSHILLGARSSYNYFAASTEYVQYGMGIKNKTFFASQQHLSIFPADESSVTYFGVYSNALVNKRSIDGALWYDEIGNDGVVVHKKLGDNEPSLTQLSQPLSLTAVAGLNSILLTWDDQNESYRRSLKIVVLGSSTAVGSGASTSANRWVNRFTVNMESVSVDVEVINVALGGYDTYKYMPDSYVPSISGRPLPDPLRNITYAISQTPDFIILNNAGNDISNGYDIDTETKPNYLAIKSEADTAGIPIYFTTTQPRSTSAYTAREKLKALADWIKNTLVNSINIYDGLVHLAPGDSNLDLTLKTEYDSGDGLHINDAGHLLVSDTASPVFTALVLQSKRVSNYVVERSLTTGSGFSVLATIDPLLETYEDTTAAQGTQYYYRVKALPVFGYSESAYSNEDDAIIQTSSLTQVMKLNFGAAASATGWFNVVNGSAITNANGAASNCTVTTSGFSNGSGAPTPDSGTGLNLPDDVMNTYNYASTTPDTITFTGQAGKKYTFKIFGSRNGSDSRIADYTINGVTKSLEAIGNTSNIVVFNDIPLDGSNQIIIQVVANSASTTTFGYINAMVIEEYTI